MRNSSRRNLEPFECVYVGIQGTGSDSQFKATAKLGEFLETGFSQSF